MSEDYNFVPDYETWWAKEGLNKEQLIWLIIGINPDDIKRHSELEEKEILSHEEKNWKFAFMGMGGYVENLPKGIFLSDTVRDFNNLIKWQNKEQFVKDTYEFKLIKNDFFLDYLIGINAFQRNDKLESYKDFSKYLFNFENFKPRGIKTEDEAFCILLGLNETYFSRFFKLDEEIKSKPRNNEGYVEYINFSPDDKWFYSEYRKFLESLYGDLNQYKPSLALKKSKELNAWNGNFEDYTQSLHNQGFIFKNEIYEALEKEGIILKYLNDGRAIQFYKYWIKKGGWTLSEATHLFRGENPKTEKLEFQDFSQNPFLLYRFEKHFWSYNLFTKEYEDLTEIILRHCAVSNLKAHKTSENELYKPKEITEWLMQNTLHIPPKALLQVLDIQESKEAAEQRIANKQAQGKQTRKNELHICIGHAWQTVQKTAGIKPSANDVWEYIEKNLDSYECIQSIEESKKTKEIAIKWKSQSGIEQELNRSSFNNVVSAFNNGRKVYDQSLNNFE